MEAVCQSSGDKETPMTLGQQIAWDDTVLPFQLDASDMRGRVARLDGALNGILKQHDYPPQVEALVAGPVERSGADDRNRLLRSRGRGRTGPCQSLCKL